MGFGSKSEKEKEEERGKKKADAFFTFFFLHFTMKAVSVLEMVRAWKMSPVRAESPDRSRWNNKAYDLRGALYIKVCPYDSLETGRIVLSHPIFQLRGIYFDKMAAEKREKLEGKLQYSTPFSRGYS